MVGKKIVFKEDADETKLFDCLENIDFLDENEKKYIKELSSVSNFSKDSFIIKEGQYLNKCYTILKGCVKEYYLVNGEEKITHFYLEGDSLTSAMFVKEKKAVNFFWECIEDAVVSWMSHENELMLFEMIPKLQTIGRECNEYDYAEYKEKINQFLIASPEERYQEILTNKPELIERVPLYMLASYIGIKAESLSRIRKRMRDKAYCESL
jgi:CRP-like cAMP-binding protein